ncbi:MAG: HAD family acid phosphatase [bacterium]
MRRRLTRSHAVSAVLLAVVCSCSTAPPPSPPVAAAAPGRGAVPNLFDVQGQISQYVDSGRYDSDVARVAYQAQEYLEMRAGQVAKPAVVLDIDETALSNWPAYRANGWARIANGECDLRNGPCGLHAWQAMAKSKALKATLALAQRAKGLGVAVFFISGRAADLRAATEQNLRDAGYSWDGLTIFAPGAQFARSEEFKVPERRRIAAQGYTILFTLGDQQSDLSGGFAERTYKLPNPVYFVP